MNKSLDFWSDLTESGWVDESVAWPGVVVDDTELEVGMEDEDDNNEDGDDEGEDVECWLDDDDVKGPIGLGDCWLYNAL